jgi:hypothetical protein
MYSEKSMRLANYHKQNIIANEVLRTRLSQHKKNFKQGVKNEHK